MAAMARPLPPLNSIRAFEVAAQHLNFTRAADELGVTQSAVSKQISILEDYIGAKLFERLPGGLGLTLEGRTLKESISPAFAMLTDAFARFSRRPPRSTVVRLATVASFAGQFLVPRLDAFAEALPDVSLEILTSDRVVDFEREEIDFSVRYGAGDWDGLVSSELVPGELAPVCAPDFLEAHSGEGLAETVGSARRIRIYSSDEWRAWQEIEGVSLPEDQQPVIMEHFMVAAQAVLSGQGLALVPAILIQDELATGRLVQFSPTPVPWPDTFHIAHPPNAERRAIVAEVIAWLRAEAAASR
ncbi:MAG: LysR substrate-binding domain-containing protein [Pseudomonadota bacterium]